MSQSSNNTASSYKPIAYQGPKKYPYWELHHREFEELLYSIFDADINNHVYDGKFDKVSLRTGVGERGRDCSLHFKGNNVGLIQCKKVKGKHKRISKPSVAKEIIKFILHYIKDKSLITDINNFTYYFATSLDFSEPALDLINSFNTSIIIEQDLKKWTQEVINEYEGLSDLNYDDIDEEMKEVLRSISVKEIIPTFLDIKLSQYPQIADHFFEGQVVFIDQDYSFHELLTNIMQEINKKNIRSPEVKKAIINRAQLLISKFEEMG